MNIDDPSNKIHDHIQEYKTSASEYTESIKSGSNKLRGSIILPDLRCWRKVIGGEQESVDATLRERVTA